MNRSDQKNKSKAAAESSLAQQVVNFPIGTVVSYGGDLLNNERKAALQQAGWLVCDGTAYEQSDYPDLYNAIKFSNGGAGTKFNVPDLRNRFLRGASGAAMIDPDASNRVEAATGGAVGNNVGSLQETATALPNNQWTLSKAGAHTHTCIHLNADMHQAWSGRTYTMARWNADAETEIAGNHHHEIIGFDKVTAPINIALNFLIKASQPETPTGTIPAGAITAFAGTLNTMPANWVRCDGAAYGKDLYPALLDTILYNFGGDGTSVLNVPDLRGYFLRGTNHNTKRDPDAASRHELNTGGNTGDNIGSAQRSATASPVGLKVKNAGAHSHNIAKVPQEAHQVAHGASGPAAKNCMEWTTHPTTSTTAGDHNHSIIGGDKETRPKNVYVDFLINTHELSESAPPIGSIMPFGGDITDASIKTQLSDAGWLPCDGSKLRVSAFRDLYTAIGTTFGSAPLKFSLPDLRGYFVIGAGDSSLGSCLNTSTTGIPVTPIITSTDGAHKHIMHNIPTETHVIDVVLGPSIGVDNPNQSPTSTDGDHTHTISGGDLESRPVNVNVDYIIRVR